MVVVAVPTNQPPTHFGGVVYDNVFVEATSVGGVDEEVEHDKKRQLLLF
jgi:hypothetical protein